MSRSVELQNSDFNLLFLFHNFTILAFIITITVLYYRITYLFVPYSIESFFKFSYCRICRIEATFNIGMFNWQLEEWHGAPYRRTCDLNPDTGILTDFTAFTDFTDFTDFTLRYFISERTNL